MSNEDRSTYSGQAERGEAQYPVVQAPPGVDVEAYRVYRGGAMGPDSAQAQPELSIRDLLYVVFRHKIKIAVSFVLICAATVFYIAAAKDTYISEAQIYIRPDRSNLEVDLSGSEDALISPSFNAGVDVEIALIRSRDVIGQVVDRIGVNKIRYRLTQGIRPPEESDTGGGGFLERSSRAVMSVLNFIPMNLTPRDKAIISLQRNLEIQRVRRTTLIRLTYVSLIPELSQEILAMILEVHREHRREISENFSPQYFKDKSEEIERQLAIKEALLTKRKKELSVVSMSSQKELLLQQINQLQETANQNEIEISSLEAKTDALRRRLDTMSQVSGEPSDSDPSSRRPVVRVETPLVIELNQKLLELKLEKGDLASRYQVGTQPMREIQSRIEQLQARLVEELARGEERLASGEPVLLAKQDEPVQESLTLRLETTWIDLEGKVAEGKALELKIAETRGQLNRLLSHETELKNLERDVEILERQYTQYLNTYQIAEESAAFGRDKISNLSLIQTATLPVMSVKNKRKLLAVMGLGIFAGLGFGLVLAFGLEFMDHTFKTSEDVERRLGLPVLVSLPIAKDPQPRVQGELV